MRFPRQLKNIWEVQADSLGIYSSDAAASRVAEWLQTCEETHGRCQQDVAIPELPTRILEIQGPERVRLLVTEHNQRDLYACLSHCWGDLSMIRTTQVTCADFQVNVPWSDLPLTFRHAIDLAQRLGLTYLWIDSLCIMQDDADDWRHEGSKLASIYADAYITIAAVASHNAFQGLYRPNQSRFLTNCELRRNASSTLRKLHVGQKKDEIPRKSSVLPLFRRAWFHQERILSRRIVLFGIIKLYWECRVTRRCECEHMSDASQMNTPQFPSSGTASNTQRWYNLVEFHSSLSLTFEKDIFSSLQGIATM
ncbi:HET-domain-containing protein [Setomelanomma holmii]|uniref:HET-domain-containing protein n=1 Tax=Setomelanomma holmii TaxID=210430 RepID=A0A9P4HD31_9PLEO|nr:HET-domain-containing protein [Setomelanomma holmii]